MEGRTHSLVMVMNGTREGSHTDPAASQVDQFAQPVFEAERKRKQFMAQLWAPAANDRIKASMCSFPAAYCVLKHKHGSLLKVSLRHLGQNSRGKIYPTRRDYHDKFLTTISWGFFGLSPVTLARYKTLLLSVSPSVCFLPFLHVPFEKQFLTIYMKVWWQIKYRLWIWSKPNFNKCVEAINLIQYVGIKYSFLWTQLRKVTILFMAKWKETFHLLSGSCPTSVVPITNKLIPMKAKVTLKKEKKR